jgi:hypothetical protein
MIILHQYGVYAGKFHLKVELLGRGSFTLEVSKVHIYIIIIYV